MADKIKLAVAILLVIAGIAGYYLLGEQAAVLRVLSVIAGLGAGAAVGWLSEPGKRFHAFGQESIAEAKKVAWPTRKESMQATGLVFAFVAIMGAFLWIIDAGFLVIVQWVVGTGGQG